MEQTTIQQGQTMLAPIRSYSHKELTDLYEVSHVVFRGWLAPHKSKIGKLTGKRYTIKQVETIFHELGRPYLTIKKHSSSV
ncbi:MAG: hypothetical protein EWV91_07075 [Microcystis aeruginosa Ma_QC_Ca_00000000_S207]|uniref:DUF4248 domain-containing protein n=1 Tax=Microcystis aeruginosa Ma_QC_Ca_00000000_S207 TaxID=2486251 RepID=A0A552FT08_MICAE|nr:MAG: hypothetical protein EWV91_07075 [Microcystis aeruginosa Ma_QC_Ca_00000000_S207]